MVWNCHDLDLCIRVVAHYGGDTAGAWLVAGGRTYTLAVLIYFFVYVKASVMAAVYSVYVCHYIKASVEH
ncbi:hypothetical protein E2C01_087496 [Portunus trituberculatus]|uniref:Uncharacterized protein n=1 Tax=Portunus trituberculatus TaxID=210409 RepID=A0A5B7JHF8_PORTR|nr:hypothetical protein [Portunus trituberculatus]